MAVQTVLSLSYKKMNYVILRLLHVGCIVKLWKQDYLWSENTSKWSLFWCGLISQVVLMVPLSLLSCEVCFAMLHVGVHYP